MHHRRRSLTLTVVFLLALVAGSGWLGGSAAPAAQAQARPRVVYVYNTDTASRDSFKTLLELRGFDVTLATPAEVTGATAAYWANVYALVIGDDTANPANLYDWSGRTLPVPDSLYVVGIGQGGASFFEEDQDPLGDIAGVPVIGYGNSWSSSGKRAYAVDPAAAAWNSPTPIAIPPSGLVDLYMRPVPFYAPYSPAATAAGGVTRIGRQEDDQQHYPLIAQTFSGQTGSACGLLWGFRRPPSQMTPTGRDVFVNLLKNNPCGAGNVAPVDVSITKTSDKSGIVGQPLTYTLKVANNGATLAPAVKAVDTLPPGVVFVSASSTHGTCSYGAGVVTCQVGDLAGGATATITIVVKPTEAGTLVNSASATARAADPNTTNNSATTQTPVNNSPLFPPITALPYKPVLIGTILPPPNIDLSIFGIEITEGIQCFDSSKGLASCSDNSLPLVAQKDAAARIYIRCTGSGCGSGINNVPVRLTIIANGVTYTANASGKALAAIDQGSASSSANVYFNVNFANGISNVQFKAEVDPNNVIAETNNTNNVSATYTKSFSKRTGMRIVGQRLRYHPSGYSGSQYAGGWAVNGGAADWYEQLLPIKNGGIDYVVSSGYKDWTTTLNGDGQHALIQSLNTQWLMQNAFSWLFGTGAFTSARHVYGWAPNSGYSGGHADMPIYPHAGGLGVVGIGTDAPGTSTDSPGAGALIFGHELTHDYNLMHTNTGGDDCGSDDSNSDFPYATSSIQEYGFNPYTGKVYDPANTHDLMSYCPAGGSKLGWISPFTWQRMFNNLNSTMVADARLAQLAPESVLVVNVTVANPALGPDAGAFGELAKVDTPAPLVMPAAGDYAVRLLDGGGGVLSTVPFSVTFKSEYSGHGGDEPGDPSARPLASAAMTIPWVEGTANIVLLHGGVELARRSVSANAPLVQITSPNTAVAWTAGTTETLTWQAADPDAGDVLTYSVFYSHDGSTWALLASGLTSESYDVDVDALAGGAAARFRVVASDGVNIGDDQTDFPISVPDKAPQALILNPADQAQVLPGDLLVLQGSGNDFEDGTLPDLALSWSSDRQGPLGAGVSLPVNNLLPGPHKITLSATDSSGQTSQSTVEVFIGAKLHLPIVLR